MEGNEEVLIMEEMPHTLRREIALVVNRRVFDRLQLFYDFPERQLRAIANMMAPIKVRSDPVCPRNNAKRGNARARSVHFTLGSILAIRAAVRLYSFFCCVRPWMPFNVIANHLSPPLFCTAWFFCATGCLAGLLPYYLLPDWCGWFTLTC